MSYASIWQGKKAEILAAAKHTRTQHPGDWNNTNTEGAPGREMFVRRVAWACRGITVPNPNGEPFTVGLNWKRGVVGQLSLDALALVNPSGARDKTGAGNLTKPGLELVDFIVAHGIPSASIGDDWNDVTQVSIDTGAHGGYITPTDPDTTSLPGSGGGGTQPPVFAFPSYGELGDDAFFRSQIGVPLQADVDHAGESLNDGSSVWFSRATYRLMSAMVKHRLGLGPAPNPAAEVRIVREEWRAVLKQNHPGLEFPPL